MDDKDAIINDLRQQVNGLHYEVLEQKKRIEQLERENEALLTDVHFYKNSEFYKQKFVDLS